MEEKTRLQKIVEQKTEQIRKAIEQSIDEDAEIIKRSSHTNLLECCLVDGLYLQKDTVSGSISVVLTFHSEKIAKVFKPSKKDLEILAGIKRAELEEIENQLKSE